MHSTLHISFSTLRGVRWNTFWLLSGRLTGQLALFLLALFVARFLGDEGLGAYALITTVLFIGNVFSTFGLDTFLIRQIARQGQTRMAALAPALLLQLLLSLVFLFVVQLFPPSLLTAGSLPAALFLALLSLLPLAFATVFSAALRAYEQMLAANIVITLSALGQMTAAFFYLRNGGDLAGIALILLLGQIGAALGMGLFCRWLLPDFTFNWQLARPHQLWSLLRMGTPLAMLMGLSVVYQRLGVLLLSRSADAAVLGHFSAAARLIDGARLLPYAFFGALFPIMARRRQGGQIPHQYAIIFPLLIGFLLVAILLFWGLAPMLIPLLFGPDYTPAISALRLYAPVLLPFLFSLRYAMEWVASGHERRLAVVTLGVLLLTALLGWAGYGRLGLNGLCLALVIGETVQALLLMVFYPRRQANAFSPIP